MFNFLSVCGCMLLVVLVLIGMACVKSSRDAEERRIFTNGFEAARAFPEARTPAEIGSPAYRSRY